MAANPDQLQQAILAELERRPELELKKEGDGKFRLNSPLRTGSNSHSCQLNLKPPSGKTPGLYDHRDNSFITLKDLADHLGINGHSERPPLETSKRTYTGLADYAQAHGVTADVFEAAGWSEVTQEGRSALCIQTESGPRYRFLDGDHRQAVYKSKKGYKNCWYRLPQAVDQAHQTDQALIICNGEASTVVAQFYNLAATAVTGGEKSKLSPDLLKELQTAYLDGPIFVAFDCDSTGRDKGPRLAEQLNQVGYQARAVDLALGIGGGDLADFCKLHTDQATQELTALDDIPPELKLDDDETFGKAQYVEKNGWMFYRKWAIKDNVPEPEDKCIAPFVCRIEEKLTVYTEGEQEVRYILTGKKNGRNFKAKVTAEQWADSKKLVSTILNYLPGKPPETDPGMRKH